MRTEDVAELARRLAALVAGPPPALVHETDGDGTAVLVCPAEGCPSSSFEHVVVTVRQEVVATVDVDGDGVAHVQTDEEDPEDLATLLVCLWCTQVAALPTGCGVND